MFLNGGPSHVDTFDPKPALKTHEGKQPEGELYRKYKGTGFVPSPLQFAKHGRSGIEVSELFEKTGAHIDDIAVIRSMKAKVPNHEPSLMLMNCGDARLPRPSMGSWVVYGLGTENQNLPGFITIKPSLGHGGQNNWRSSFLPGDFQGTAIGNSGMKVEEIEKEPVPYLLHDSASQVAGRDYTETATADCPVVAAHTLLARMVTSA